ncbi:MAG: transposase [Nanoarchaeota archaeon]|nr:transposase [Nanoarchaeota archaeon]
MAMKTHKFRLYPSKNVEIKMLNTLELCRQAYNELLGLLNEQKVIDKAQIQGTIPDMKICDKRYKQLYSKTMQYECFRLFSSLSALAKTKKRNRKVGRLRFKGRGRFKTFTYNQSGFKIIKTGKRHQTLLLSKIGEIPIKCHREIKGKIKQIILKIEASGKWFAFVVEQIDKEIKPMQTIKNVVGLDVGLDNFVYDSEGNAVKNPRHLNKYKEQLAKLQRQLSKKKKKSINRNKQRIKVARMHEKIANSRNDFLHKLSHYYVSNYDAIGMEDMLMTFKSDIFAKSKSDASWGKFRQFIAYKAESAGKLFVPVPYKGTTQRCSQCGETVHKELWDREHNCPCGFIAPRDYNSALEIKRLMLKKLEIGQELPKSTSAENRALPPLAATFVFDAGNPTL